MPQGIIPLFSDDTTPVNEFVAFQKRDGMVYYFHGCLPIFSHPEGDKASFRMFTSQLYITGNCKQSEIVRAFGVTPISVKRAVKKSVSYTHLRAHETVLDLVCRLMLEK